MISWGRRCPAPVWRGAALTTNPDNQEPGALPRLFGRYRLLHLLGRGGMGDVYLAKHAGLAGIERYCVVKIVATTRGQAQNHIARFFDEARVVVLMNHQNICGVSDVGEVDGQLYLAMDYVSGQNLNAVLSACNKRPRELPRGLALFILGELLKALDYAHRLKHPSSGEALGIVHRDVSPHNLLLSDEGEVKLIDFGIAVSTLKQEKTSEGFVLGKLAYISPEQARSDTVGVQGDIYAAGIVGYELLTGERFYAGRNPADLLPLVLQGGYRPRDWHRLEPALARILERALQPEPSARYESCGEFRRALEAYQQDHGLVASADALRAFLRELFPHGEEEHRALLARLDAAAPPIPDDTVVMAAVPEDAPSLPPSTVVDRRPAGLDALSGDAMPAPVAAVAAGEPLGVPLVEPLPEVQGTYDGTPFAEQGVRTVPLGPQKPAPGSVDAIVPPSVVVDLGPEPAPAPVNTAPETTEWIADRHRVAAGPDPVEHRPRRGLRVALTGFSALVALVVILLLVVDRAAGPAASDTPAPTGTPVAAPDPGLEFGDDALAAVADPEGGAAVAGAGADAGADAGGDAGALAAAHPSSAGSTPAADDQESGADAIRPPPDPGKRAAAAHRRTPRTSHRSARKAAAAKPPTALNEKLDVLRSCKGQPCAPQLLDRSTRLSELDYAQVKSFPAELDRCVRRCLR